MSAARAFPAETYERPSWRQAASLIEQSRRWRTPGYHDPAARGLAEALEGLRLTAEMILESGEYEKDPAGLPARVVCNMMQIMVEVRDYGLTDLDAVIECLQELIAHAFESIDCVRSEKLPAQVARCLAVIAASLQDRKAAMQ